mmetsp:Transcript_12569/g.29435  ORF Transcript_12569/g.29435 Transcript_12569/m.29435 type:complete len:336 (+) Transcript_12569:83-1090(+)|eukprot:CAMPEP_0172397524 /NCGR_PEP_ID=MMETSP1061-20121228/31048_1 /TAXON_ID=37318 /ORGANISM="Pseudo-nitzschia pungens, Strain cf. pungens" /LENGTH=335 /DNA_ID=CAMNT_0013129729 /DNA_START=29 /DNA_END=1036 /DNA_ORIENTATION=-
MRSNYMLEAAAAVFLAVQSMSMGVEGRVDMPGVDPENYVSNEVAPDVARGGIRKLHDQGVLHFQEEDAAEDEKMEKRNLRSLQTGFDDDTVLAEEIITIEYYQDNRFSPVEPIYANVLNKQRNAAGNKWLYANVPLQPIFGINDLPIQGLAQGFCESLYQDQDGFCHFTYEFFDLVNGAITVYASITAEGATVPQGPSKLNILGGTGEFSGAAGTVTLWPVGIDESTVPARIFKDGSLFLGNLVGYEMKLEASVRYLLNAPLNIPVPSTVAVPATASNAAIPVANTASAQATAGFASRVTCPGQIESEYCDCDLDCTTTSARCQCAEAQACCEQR